MLHSRWIAILIAANFIVLPTRTGLTSTRPDAARLALLRSSRETRADQIASKKRREIIKQGSKRSNSIALTFDDGPHPELTVRVLKVLKTANVRATFFMTGRNVRAYAETARQVVAAGHEIANHTFTHPNLTKISAEEVELELSGTSDVCEEILGVSPEYCRPPGGQFNTETLRAIREQGMTTVLWTANPADYSCETPHDVALKVLKAAKPGGIILLHDTWDLSVEALPEILAGLKKRGLRVVPIGALR